MTVASHSSHATAVTTSTIPVGKLPLAHLLWDYFYFYYHRSIGILSNIVKGGFSVKAYVTFAYRDYVRFRVLPPTGSARSHTSVDFNSVKYSVQSPAHDMREKNNKSWPQYNNSFSRTLLFLE